MMHMSNVFRDLYRRLFPAHTAKGGQRDYPRDSSLGQESSDGVPDKFVYVSVTELWSAFK